MMMTSNKKYNFSIEPRNIFKVEYCKEDNILYITNVMKSYIEIHLEKGEYDNWISQLRDYCKKCAIDFIVELCPKK